MFYLRYLTRGLAFVGGHHASERADPLIFASTPPPPPHNGRTVVCMHACHLWLVALCTRQLQADRQTDKLTDRSSVMQRLLSATTGICRNVKSAKYTRVAVAGGDTVDVSSIPQTVTSSVL